MLAVLPDQKTDDDLAPLQVSRVTLTDFRNYADISLQVETSPVVLTGANGSGKTNLLEAISLLVPGRGLKRGSPGDFQRHGSAGIWAVAAELRTGLGHLQIGTGRDPSDAENERRVVHIDGKPVRNQNALAERMAMAWITPDMDRVLAEGASARRKLLDRLAYSFDPAHSGRVNRYEKAMRERLRLLREGPRDANWLSALEDEMAQTGVAIAAARGDLLRQLRYAIEESESPFPKADIGIEGIAEDALESNPALAVEDMLRAAFARARQVDGESGTTSVGPHKSDLLVMHRVKNCPAELCSTGEQKALLIAIMLAYLRTLMRRRRVRPLFLLDDIAAHLDDHRRSALFEEIRALGVQAWLTGTDAEAFESLLPHAQHFDVEQGNLHRR